MKVTGFNHLAIVTEDLEKSLAFYRGVLGFKQLETAMTPEFSSTNLVTPDGSFVELLGTDKKTKRPADNAAGVVNHVTFNVDDVRAAEKELKKAGVEIVMPSTDLDQFNTRVVKCKDPSGVVIALRHDLR